MSEPTTTETQTAETQTAETQTAETQTAETQTAENQTAENQAAEAGPRSARKLREGVVVSDSMDKTAVVAVVERVRHPRYNKFVRRTKRLYVHDEANDAHTGDRVRVMETRPLSKTKRWRVVEILERAK